MTKRLLDVSGALLGLILLSPLLLLIAALIKLDSPGPVLFRQERMGRGARAFFLYKFRTMVTDASLRGGLLTVGEDARITRVGRWLRKSKLDELPQLFNVLKGDMSLVGPRPEVRRYVELFRRDYEVILAVRPGITDPASLKFRDEAAILGQAVDPEQEYVQRVLPEKIRLAKDYLVQASLMFDLTLIVNTLVKLALENIAPAVSALRSQPLVVACVYLLLIVLSNYLAFLLRLGGRIPFEHWDPYLRMLPWLVVIQGATLIPLRLDKRLNRSSETLDFRTIIVGVLVSTLLFYILVHGIVGLGGYPRSIFILNPILLILFLSRIRHMPRIFRHLGQVEQQNQVLSLRPGARGR